MSILSKLQRIPKMRNITDILEVLLKQYYLVITNYYLLIIITTYTYNITNDDNIFIIQLINCNTNVYLFDIVMQSN